MAQRVTDIYNAWFKIWSTVAVPKLAERTKWFKPNKNLEVNDIVYFQKDSSSIDSQWVTGMIEEVVMGNDGLVREIVIRYRNATEDFDRFTNRAARSCVRLFNLDDQNLYDDLHELTERLNNVEGGDHLVSLLLSDPQTANTSSSDSNSRSQISPYASCSSLVESQEEIIHGLLTPRSRSPISQSQEDLDQISRALSNEGVKTPVIVSTSVAYGNLLTPTPLVRTRSLSPTPESKESSRPAKHPPVFGKGSKNCKICCCVSHHNFKDHRLKYTEEAALAYDVNSVQLTFKNSYVDTSKLKNQEQFCSLNDMIWSCELHLN